MKLNSKIRQVLSIGAILATAAACVDIDRGADVLGTEKIDFSVHIADNHDRTKASSSEETSTKRYGNDVVSVEVSPMEYSTESLTKGAQISDIKQLGTSGIFAYYTQDAGSTFITYMDNQQITYSATDGEASYSPIKYWPVADGTTSYLNFYGYSPYLTQGTAGADGLLLTSGISPTVTYDTPSSTADQPDFMIAARQTNMKKEGDPIIPVNQNFRHALSSVRVRVYGNGHRVYSISIKNIRSKGVTAISDVTDVSTISWSLDATKKTFDATINYDPGQTYVEVNPISSDVMSGYFMTLPQPLEDDAVIVLKYLKIPFTGSVITKEIPLKQSGLTAWEAGNCYNYDIIITPFTYFNVTPVLNEYTYAGGQTDYVVGSYWIEDGGLTKNSLTWTAKYVADDGLTPISDPDWMTLSNVGDVGGDNTTYKATVQPQTPAVVSPEDLQLRGATEKVDFDLSDAGTKTANCYVVNAAGTYKFPANVMGVGATGWFSGAVDYAGNLLTSGAQTVIDLTNAYPKLLWQDVPGAITELSLGADGYINFHTAAKSDILQANASIAIVNKGPDHTEGTSDDMIMWSWHIWITNLDLASSIFEINFGTSYTMFRYPLGFRTPTAISTVEKKIKVRFTQEIHLTPPPEVVIEFIQNPSSSSPTYSVLFYQSGRKDPFVATAPITGAQETMYDFYNNVIEYDYTLAVPTDKPYTYGWGWTLESNKYNVFIKNPVLMPIRNKTTWCNDVSGNVDDYWGEGKEKTIYDPSPYGYRVPPKGVFTGFERTVNQPAVYNGFTFKVNSGGTEVFLPRTGLLFRASTSSNNPPKIQDPYYIYFVSNANSHEYAKNDVSTYFCNNATWANMYGYRIDNPTLANCYGKAILPIKYIP